MGVANAGSDWDSGPQRFILGAQVTTAGDLPQLPTSGQWAVPGSGRRRTMCSKSWSIRWPPVPRSLFHPSAWGEECLCSKVVPMGWVSATGVIPHVHHRLLSALLSIARRELAPEIREDQPLMSDDSSTTFLESSRCSTRGKVSSRPAGPQDLYVGPGSVDSKGKASIWSNPFRVNNAGSAAKAAELHQASLHAENHWLSQLHVLDCKRLLCLCSPGSTCHVDVLLSCWRLLGSAVSRTRSMWQYIVHLDVIEVCDWSDVSELIASGNHEHGEQIDPLPLLPSLLLPRLPPLHAGACASLCPRCV